MDTVTFVLVILTHLVPGQQQLDTIYVSNADEIPYVLSRRTELADTTSRYFAQVPTDTAVHYIDHQRRRRAVQRVASHLGVAEGKHFYQFNGSKFFED